MFRSAVVRLTLGYLLFIMLLSGAFSGVLYRLSKNELDRDFHRRVTLLEQGPLHNLPGVQELIAVRTEQIEESADHLRRNLALMNLIILALGGGLAYYLARRNLAPIEATHEAQRRFTADASHELRTPLAAMRSEIEVALRSQQLSLTEARALLRSNLEEVAKLEVLSDRLLRLARHERQLETQERVALKEIVTEAVAAVRRIALKKKMHIEIDVEDLVLAGDRWSLGELAKILLDNAIKYSSPNSTIWLAVRRSGDQAELEVRDAGIGIKPADLPHIFERFYRADHARSHDRPAAGYGLGLAIAKEIAAAHRGTIRVTSSVGKGTTFHIRLPL